MWLRERERSPQAVPLSAGAAAGSASEQGSAASRHTRVLRQPPAPSPLCRCGGGASPVRGRDTAGGEQRGPAAPRHEPSSGSSSGVEGPSLPPAAEMFPPAFHGAPRSAPPVKDRGGSGRQASGSRAGPAAGGHDPSAHRSAQPCSSVRQTPTLPPGPAAAPSPANRRGSSRRSATAAPARRAPTPAAAPTSSWRQRRRR